MMFKKKNNIKVLEVIYAFQIGGSERLAALIATELRKDKINTAVCAVHGYDGPISKQLKGNGIPCYGIGAPLVSAIIVRYRLYKLFRRLRPNVIHVHHVTQLAVAYWPARLAGIRKIILTEHANYSITVQSKLRRQARFYSKRADLVTTVHDGLSEYFHKELYVKEGKIITIPNGINTEDYCPGVKDPEFYKELGLSDEILVFTCIGRLVEAKDHNNLFKSIKLMVQNGCSGFNVLIVGGGPLESEIKIGIANLGIEKYVTLLGERSDIKNILNNSDIFVLSSKREGFPMCLLEAMSTGLPCVATDVGAISKIINRESGFVVEPGNSNDLAHAMIDLYRNQKRLNEMGKCARNIVVENYSINKVLRMYKDILGGD